MSFRYYILKRKAHALVIGRVLTYFLLFILRFWWRMTRENSTSYLGDFCITNPSLHQLGLAWMTWRSAKQFWKWNFWVRKTTTNSWLRFKMIDKFSKCLEKSEFFSFFFPANLPYTTAFFLASASRCHQFPPPCHASLHKSWSCFCRTLCGSWPELFGRSVCRSHCGHSSELQAESGTGGYFWRSFFHQKWGWNIRSTYKISGKCLLELLNRTKI